MRGLAAQSVIFFHFCAISPVLQTIVISTIGIPLAWNSGVDFFFVLSGFLLAIPFMQMRKTNLKSYYMRRSLRILPAYYVSFFFILLFLSKNVTTQDIIATIFFSQNFFQSTFTSINGVYWTLAIEEIFYATLPLFVLLFLRGRWIYSLPICVAISTTYREVIFSLYHANLYNLNFYLWQYPSYLEHYAIGVSLAALFVQGKISPGKIRNYYPLIGTIFALIVTMYILGKEYPLQGYDFPLSNLIFAIEYGALIAFTISSPATSRVRALFTNRIATIAGKLSYSTYVWHLPIEITLYSLRLPIIGWMASSYLIIIAVAALTYHLVEKPFLRLKDKISITREPRIFQKEITLPKMQSSDIKN